MSKGPVIKSMKGIGTCEFCGEEVDLGEPVVVSKMYSVMCSSCLFKAYHAMKYIVEDNEE